MTQVVVAARCTWCSRQVAPKDLLHFSTGQRMCPRCYEWHAHALQVLGGALPRGCQSCHLTLAALNDLTNAATTRMYVVPIDGIYGVLCAACKDDYCRKRADLYKDTKFGREELKLG